MRQAKKLVARKRRHLRIRQKVSGNSGRLRLSVYRSLNHIYAQMVDDTSGKTLVSASSLMKDISTTGSKMDVAKEVGRKLAILAKGASIERVVFDRGGYRYHGRIMALADAVREGGIIF